MLVALFALQIAAGAPAPASSTGGERDSVSTISRLRQDASDFVWVWRFYWEASETARHDVEGGVFDVATYPSAGYGLAGPVSLDRINRLHCHPDGREGFPVMSHVIRERHRTLRAVCPDWLFDGSGTGDERLSIDDGLIPRLRSGVRLARGALIADLERAAHELPGDPWIAGQRVRFAVDQHDWRAARLATDECRAARWWCAALSGYVLHARGQAAAADSAFTVSSRAMPAAQRCAWGDLAWLLDESAQDAYRKVPCAARDSVNRRIWWLSDPLYTEAGNERRAEHFSRVVLATLRAAVEPAERWNWRDGGGGNALREAVVRYGWPSYSWWAGPGVDVSHYGYLNIRNEETQRLGVFTTMEYTRPRYHTVPAWSAISDPWQASASAWDLTGRPADDDDAEAEWWPREHYARDGSALAPIDDQQTAMLRRHSAVELVVAADLSSAGLGGGAAATAQGSLIVSPAPDSFAVTTSAVAPGATGVWRTMVPSAPAIVGVEVHAGGPAATVARTRFGVVPPPPLSAMARGDIAISPPILMQPHRGASIPDSDPRTALQSMLGTTRLRTASRIGLYWETYGIARGDSVDIGVAIVRRDAPNALTRLGRFLHLVGRPSNTVTIRWREPQPGYVSTSIDGPEPIQGRNISLDLSRLAPDRYTVVVSVTRLGQTVSASREFEILPH